jgi:hypothetical protein
MLVLKPKEIEQLKKLKADSLRFLSFCYFQKNHIIDTFLRHHLLNLITHKKIRKKYSANVAQEEYTCLFELNSVVCWG